MLDKRYLPFLLFLFILQRNVYGQDVNHTSQEYLTFEASGLPGNEIKTIVNAGTVNVISLGGFFKVHISPVLRDHIYLKQYEKSGQRGGVDLRMKDQKKNWESNTEIYLQPDSEMLFEVWEKSTHKLLRKYVLQRPKAIPQLTFSDQSKDFKNNLYVFRSDGQSDKVDLNPGIKLVIAPVERTDFKNLEITYTLLNLKTHKSYSGIIKEEMSPLDLVSGDDYELRVSYTIQQESVGTIFISVKPYWFNSIFFYVSISIALLALVLLLFNKRLKNNLTRSRKKQYKLEEEAIKLQSLLNPHFTFNALSSIQGLMNSGKIDEANNYLHAFSSLLRKSLSKSQNVFHSLEEELEMMKIYISLEALRFNFTWDIKVNDSLHTSEIEIPTMILQPLIENAVKHGLAGSTKTKNLTITCGYGAEKDSLVIVVKDSGQGMDENTRYGYGLSLTQKRIETINQLNSAGKIKLDFAMKSGTEVSLTFFNWLSV